MKSDSESSLPRYDQETGNLVGPDGGSWREIKAWLEPDEVRRWRDSGALVAIDECHVGWTWNAKLTQEAMSQVVTALESHRLAKGKYPEALILAASLWENVADGRKLVVLSEESPKRRRVIQEMLAEYEDVQPPKI